MLERRAFKCTLMKGNSAYWLGCPGRFLTLALSSSVTLSELSNLCALFSQAAVALHLHETHVETRPVLPSLDGLSVQLIRAY